ncbi:MAG: magnesium transporter [Tenericutes bacterium]|nr:magnesium transporter [Mycoplasmatota bacterium]
MDNTRDIYSEIRELIIQKPENLINELEEYHIYDITQAVIELNPEEIRDFFNLIDSDFQASIFEYLEEDEAEEIIKYLPEKRLIQIISDMEIDEAVDLLKYLNKEGLRLLNKIPVKTRKELIKFMAYKEDEIGAFMSDSYITINSDISVKEAMRKVTVEAHDVDYISILYVLENKKLIGYLRLKDLLVARASEEIVDIMETRFPTVHPTDDKEAVSQLMIETSESSIPIINEENILQGIITHDDLMDIIALTEEEDYTMFAAISDAEIDIESSNLKNSIRSRLPWLTILLGLSMVTSIVLAFFQGRLSSSHGAILLAAKLAVFLPLIQGMAGNTGTQSLAVMIRYLTKNEDVDRERIRKHLFRELKTGMLQGLIIASLVFIMINVITYIGENQISSVNLIYALVTASSILIALFVSTILGALIPVFMTKAKIDPAVASGPFITTVSDIITMTIYYSVSLAILLPLFQ